MTSYSVTAWRFLVTNKKIKTSKTPRPAYPINTSFPGEESVLQHLTTATDEEVTYFSMLPNPTLSPGKF